MTVYTLDLWLCKSETHTYPCPAILPYFTYKQYSNTQDVQVFHTFYILVFLLNCGIEEAKAVQRQLLIPLLPNTIHPQLCSPLFVTVARCPYSCLKALSPLAV